MTDDFDVCSFRFFNAWLNADHGETRVYLNTVRIEPHPKKGVLIVGTDGHTLAVFYDPDGLTPRPVSLRPDEGLIAELKKAFRSRTTKKALGDKKHVRDADMPRLVAALPDSGEVWLRIDPDNVEAAADIEERNYVDWSRVVPKQRPNFLANSLTNAVDVNPGACGSFCLDTMILTRFQHCDGYNNPRPILRLTAGEKPSDPIVLCSKIPGFLGVVMPCSSGDAEIAFRWFDGRFKPSTAD